MPSSDEPGLPVPQEEERSFMPPSRTPRRPMREDWSMSEDVQFRQDVSDISNSLREVADFLAFVKRWTPWLVAAIGVLYPTVGHFISQLPPIPHP